MPDLDGVNEAELAAAFAEWDRRWREEPDEFMSDTEHLAESCETYGELCAAYLLWMLGELDAKTDAG